MDQEDDLNERNVQMPAEMQNRLQATIVRLKRDDAMSWLGFDVPEARRARYLSVVKKLHPHRWALHGPEVVKLANEAFILVQDLYKLSHEAPEHLARGSRVVPAVLRAETGADADAAPRTPRLHKGGPRIAAGTGSRPRVQPPSASEDPEALFERGVAECRAGRFEVAYELLHRAAMMCPRDKKLRARMHYARGRVLLAEGKVEQARSDLAWAARLEPDFADAREALASVARPKKRGWKLFRR